MIDYQKDLNPEQLAVVQNGDGFCLVLAGAGSGKTRAVTYRVAYLLEKGVRPENILLVTFTNKAADEMITRVQKLSGIVERLPWSGTFHHIANKILRQYAGVLGYQNNFTILDSDDSEQILKKLIKEFKTEDKFPSAKVVNNLISFSRNAGEELASVVMEKSPQWAQMIKTITTVADAYTREKKATNVMDFDDLLINFLFLLQNSSVQQKLATQFQYILVDEYQDTNRVQAAIINNLAVVHKNLLVVGDDAQSIYSFRAADIDNILKFEEAHPGAKVFKLEMNYRSGKDILDLANNVIANNLRQYKKALHPVSKIGNKPKLKAHSTKEAEAEAVAREIKKHLDAGVSPRQIAVLFRASHHSQPLELELMRADIPYEYRGGLRFFERAHIKDALAYLRLINNWADASAWTRVLLHEDGLGPVAVGKIVNLIQQMENIGELKNLGENLGEKARLGWSNFLRIWENLVSVPKKPGEMLVALSDSPYREYLLNEHVDSDERIEDLEQMSEFAKKYSTLEEFLAETALHESFSRDRVNPGVAAGVNKNDQIILSTIHQAKGLEWEAVFVINLSAGAFPSERSMGERDGLEEERRLFYVAITRAKKNLYLSYPEESGSWGGAMGGPSLFLDEVDAQLLDGSGTRTRLTILNDYSAGVTYESEDDDLPFKSTPRHSFLRGVDEL
ncbi:MAG: hypothetical protein A3J93_05000 [Candidatus Magasanikbacteria bacterium RIFOXYC2_FULL_42_28]|uniref:DNA 3'-5' helicase n=1 Tax=Candidatus Magasanikbacteria bacterium RIFOXYC2_FULL_42_28 TaxID=1798704 RepID=A0A1F6NVU8_9BACT|nr:MAG: hypothetical protein A3J93_05000 [Candidatus Magasanikbacteria bacterium RIFOXYC2_FULL_42_28]